MTQENLELKLDRMRYTKDTLSANLILVAIVLDALYFVKLYQQDVSTYFYNWEIGVSVIYNLIFMLGAFLASEGVKNRQTNYTALIVVLGIMQFVRIFQIPAKARAAVILIGEVESRVMSDSVYYYLVALLAISGVCMLVSAVTSVYNTTRLNRYKQTLESKSA